MFDSSSNGNPSFTTTKISTNAVSANVRFSQQMAIRSPFNFMMVTWLCDAKNTSGQYYSGSITAGYKMGLQPFMAVEVLLMHY